MSLPVAIHSPAQGTRKALALPLVLTVVFVALGFVSRARTNAHLAWTFCGVAAFLLCWQLWLFLASRGQGIKFAWEFVAVPSHYVQATVQFAIYVYWGWYWRNVYAEAPLILSQVVFLYIFDALLSWSRGQTWRLGFGPWPIIFSTNLFMWFHDDWYVFQFLMVALGVLGKQFIHWQRGGKRVHIFNPSALALTIVSLGLIFTGTSGYTWGEQIALTQGWPPHLFIEIFLCGLVVQYLFSVTLLTFSAVAAICLVNFLYFQTTGVYLFVNTNIPVAVFLGLHLLMTDPATTPRSSMGRTIFGGLYGVGVCAAFCVLNALALPAFYDKLVVVPILNLLAPLLDRFAAFGVLGKFGCWEMMAGPRKVNLGIMGCWVTLFLVMLSTGYVEAPHPGETIGFWAKAAEEKRVNATKYLVRLLNDFDRQNLNDASIPAGVVGAGGQGNREQALGLLCNQVGAIYAQGKLVPADPAKACHFFARACDFGNAEGCANLAIQYLLVGRAEAEADASRALSNLEKASTQMTNGRVFFILGYSYDVGRGHAVDKAKARQFYEQGAALGDLDACKKLGRMQFTGEGGPPDHSAAAVWLQKAADAQDGPSCLYLARLYHNGDGVRQDEQKAVALLEKACGLGVEPACLLLRQSRGSGP
jgi:TPR repeat protein